jgi:hypothetical protein
MVVSGQLQAPSVLALEKEPAVPIAKEDRWVLEAVSM